MSGIVSSLGAPLVPSIAHEFDVGLSQAQWALTASLLATAVFTPIAGKLTDAGHQRVLLCAGMLLVTLGTVMSAVAPRIEVLIAGRALQGMGVALTPVAFAVGGSHTTGQARARLLAMLSVAAVAGAGLGYPASSLAAEHLGLRGAYWIGFAGTALTTALAFLVIPAAEQTTTEPMDWLGSALFGLGASAFLVAMSQLTADTGALSLLALVIVAAGLLTAWARRSLRTPSPNIDLRLALRPRIRDAHLIGLLAGVSMYLFITTVVVMVQAPEDGGPGLGQSATVAGATLVPYATAGVVSGQVVAMLSRWRSREFWLAVGCGLYLTGIAILVFVGGGVGKVFLAMLLGGLGSGCVFAAFPGMVMSAVERDVVGSSLAVNMVMRYVGSSIGSALGALVIESASTESQVLTTRGFHSVLLAAAGFWVATGAVSAWSARARRPGAT